MIKDIRIGFTTGHGPICWAIRRMDRAPLYGNKTEPSAINHVLLRVIYDKGPDQIFQSNGIKGVYLSFTANLCRAIYRCRVYRYAEKSLGLHQWEMNTIENRMICIEGRGYDRWMIVLYWLAMRLRLRFPRSKNERFTCNEAVCRILSEIVPWIRDDGSQTPERLFAAAFNESSPDFFDDHPAINMQL